MKLELVKLNKDKYKIEYGVYNKDKSMKGILILEAPYNECDDCNEIEIGN